MDAKTIAAKQFARGAFGSYKSDDVDAFFQEVSGYVKMLEKERDDLKRDLKVLAEKTEEYRASEEAVQEALVKAQKYGNKIINDAKLEAEEISNAAKLKAQETVTVAQEKAYAISNEAMEQTEQLIRELKNKALGELNELKQKTAIERKSMEQAKHAASSFKADLFELYRAHLDLINRIPDISETDYVPETLPELEAQPDVSEPEQAEQPAVEAAEPEAVPEEPVKETEPQEAEPTEEPEAEPVPEEEKEEENEPEQVTIESALRERVQEEESESKAQPKNAEGDTTVIPTESIDGDRTPDDVRRTMQNTAKPVYGRKFTDLKFGSGK